MLTRERGAHTALSVIGVSRPVLNQTIATVWFSTAPRNVLAEANKGGL